MEFSRQEYWSKLLFPTPGDLSDSGIESMSLALAGGFFTTGATLEAPSLKHNLYHMDCGTESSVVELFSHSVTCNSL